MSNPSAHSAGTHVIDSLEVARMGFGAMRVTGEGIWGEPADPAGARAVLRRAVELGVQLIDTADSYGPEVSERLIGETLSPDGVGRYPDGVVVATKGGLTRPGPGRWERDCRPERLKACCEASLGRLRLERIDLYQLHAVDPDVPLEESVGALAELREQGKIRHVGLSNVTVDELRRAREIVPVVSVQNRYSLEDRGSEDVLDECTREGIAFLPWFPLAAGRLGEPGGAADVAAQELGATTAQVALAWLLARSPVVIPIPGTSSVTHLEENVAAASLRLDDGQLAALEART